MSLSLSSSSDTQTLRRLLRQRRAALSRRERETAAAAAAHALSHLPQFRRAHRIAGFFGSKGELDPMPLITLAAESGKQCYLPLLHPFRTGHLWFCRWSPGDRLLLNRFGIPEPIVSADTLLPARRLDLVVVPLLGFDAQCNRLGMGGGFYDRSFAFTRRLKTAKRPLLIGFAHDSQRVDHLETMPWDVRLDAVVSNTRFYGR